MRRLLALLLTVAAVGALHNSTRGAQGVDVTSTPLPATAPVIVSVSTSVSTSVSSSSEPVASTASLADEFPPSQDELDEEESTKYKLYASPQQKARRASRDNLSASAKLRQKLFLGAPRNATAADDALHHRLRTENLTKRKPRERTHASDTPEKIPASTTLGPEIHSNYASVVGPALLAKEIASIRGLESQEEGETPLETAEKIASSSQHLRTPRKYPALGQKSSATADVTSEVKREELPTQKTPTTFSDLIRERFPDSKPPTIVKQIQPAFKSITMPEFSDEDFALYGKQLSIQKAILEKQIINFKDTEKPTQILRTAVPLQKENNEIVVPKTTFKRRDVEDMPKKWMKVMKHHGARWVAQQESGVMLPAADGSGFAFVPKILIEDTEFLLTAPTKMNVRKEQRRQPGNKTATPPQKHLHRPGRDAHVLSEEGSAPYSFGYIVDDEHTDNFQTRYEEGGVNGVVNGCYQVLEPTGLVRTVIYRADSDGFTVLSVTEDPDKLPCSGLDSAGQFSALSASAGHRVSSSSEILPGRFKSNFPSDKTRTQNVQIFGSNPRQPSREISTSASLYATKDASGNKLLLHGGDYSFGNFGRGTSSALDAHGHLEPYASPDSGANEQHVFESQKQNQFKTLNFDLNKSSSSHSSGSSFPKLQNKSNFNSRQQGTRAQTPHFQRSNRHQQNHVKIQAKATQFGQRQPIVHEDHFGREEAFHSYKGLQNGPGTRSSSFAEVQSTNKAKTSSIYEQDRISQKQEEMSKYLQSLSDELYSSFSESNLAAAASGANLINFPFVLIPVSTFLNLRKEGHIDGDVQSFGAFIQPVQNSLTSHKNGNKYDSSYSSKSRRSQSTLTDNKLPLFHQSSKEPVFPQFPSFKTDHSNEVPQVSSSRFTSQRSARGSRTALRSSHAPRPVTSYPKVTSIAHPLQPTKVTFPWPITEDTLKSQRKQFRKLNEVKNLYENFRQNETELTRNELYPANSQDLLSKQATTWPLKISQSSGFPSLYDAHLLATQRDLYGIRNSFNLSSNYLPFRALSAFVRTEGDDESQNARRASTTSVPTKAVTATPLKTVKQVTQGLQPDQQTQFGLSYIHLPKGKPPLTGYLKQDSSKLDSIEISSPLASYPPFHDLVIPAQLPLNKSAKGSSESEFLSGSLKTLSGGQVSSKRAPIPAYLASLSESLVSGKSISGRSRKAKRVPSLPRKPRTLQLHSSDNDIQVPPSAGIFKPPKKLESMIDSPLIRSSDWIPMPPKARPRVRAPVQQVRSLSISDNVHGRGKELASSAASEDQINSQQLSKIIKNSRGSRARHAGAASRIPFSFPRPPTSAALPFSAVSLSEPISSSTASKISLSRPHRTSTAGFATRTPSSSSSSSSKRHAENFETELETHETSESFGFFNEKKSPIRSSGSLVSDDETIFEVTAKKNEGFGKFHTRESSKKINPVDGTEFNSHFYSQAN